MMSQGQVTAEDIRPRGVYSIDQILGVSQASSRKNGEGEFLIFLRAAEERKSRKGGKECAGVRCVFETKFEYRGVRDNND